MKRNYFLGAIAAFGLMTLASCGNEDDPIIDGGTPEAATGEQVIILDMQDTDVLATKSRPLYSTTNQGAEKVTNVKILAYEVNKDTQVKTLVNTYTIDDWATSSTDYAYGRKHTLKLNPKLENGRTYTFIAVGQDESDENSIPAPFKLNTGNTVAGLTFAESSTWNSSTTPGQGALLTDAVTYTAASEDKAVGEIFSGQSKPVTLDYNGGFTTNVILKRQVAGVLGYFEKIPAQVGETDVKYIRLVSSARNKQVDLTIKLDIQEDDATASGKTEEIVNGFTLDAKDAKYSNNNSEDNDAFTVYEIDLTKWFPGAAEDPETESVWDKTKLVGTVEGTRYLTAKGAEDANIWVNALQGVNASVTVADGSVLGGGFAIPFDKVANKNTFELQLLGKDKGVLKSWNVKLDVASQGVNDSAEEYNIYRNHLYQIGKRGGGDNPDKPGVDPDKPQPLDSDQEMTIRINDQWEFIHDMEIE